MKKTFLLIIMTVLLINCKNPVEKSKENFEKNIDKELDTNINFLALTMNFFYYSEHENYWYTPEYSYKDILNDEFNIGYRGLTKLKERAISISMASDKTDFIRNNERLIDLITDKLKEIKEKQKILNDVNNLIFFRNISDFIDVNLSSYSAQEKESIMYPELIFMTYTDLLDITEDIIKEMAKKIYDMEKELHKKYLPNENEKLIIRKELQLFINGKIEEKYISKDKTNIDFMIFDFMIKEFWISYNEHYKI